MRRPARCRGAGGCGLPGCRPTRPGGLPVGSSTLVRSRRSHRPEGGSDRDRHPQGQDRGAGLVAEGERARAAPGGIAHNGRQTPQWLLCRNLGKQTGHTTDTACGRLGCARKGARRAGRERAGCEDDAEHRDMAARCRGPGCPPAPGYQRTAALAASRVRVRRSRTPWRPLTRRWRRATISGRCSGKNT